AWIGRRPPASRQDANGPGLDGPCGGPDPDEPPRVGQTHPAESATVDRRARGNLIRQVRTRLGAGGDWIRTSSTRPGECGCRAPTAANSHGSPKPAGDADRCPSISSYPAPGQEGKDIVVLDRWGEDRTEGAVSSLARSPLVSVL